MRTPFKHLTRAALAASILFTSPTAAFASGSGSSGGSGGGSGSGSGGGSGSGAPACATVSLLPFYPFGNGGNQRLVVQGNVTNCGSTAATYTMTATDIGTHIDPLCAIRPTTYRLPSVASGAVQYWWQASGSGVCTTESYTIRVDVSANNSVVTSAITTWG